MKFSQLSRRIACLSALSLAIGIADASNAKEPPKKAAKAKKIALADEGEFANFSQWKEVADFIEQMVAKHGFDPAELNATLRKTHYIESVIQLIKPAPPGRPKNWQAYRARFVEPVRINAGIAFWDEHAEALARAEAQYGVPAEIIVAIIGVETVYGRNTGSFRVMDAITTLAFAYPDTPTRAARMEYFRSELENTLLFARESKIDPFTLRGSYAGAIGWPQFMPGSIRKFAVDFDGDGKIDLRTSPVDALGSVANFLVRHGWKTGEPIVFPAAVAGAEGDKEKNWENFVGQGLVAKFSVEELKAAGVLPAMDPPSDMRFGLIDLQNGAEPTEYWLGAANFFAITQYNRSYFYAMSVVDLARAVRTARSRYAQSQ